MANSRNAIANKEQLDIATKEKMLKRKASDTYQVSKLNPDFLFSDNEVIFHVTGNERTRAIFIEHFNCRFDLYSASVPSDLSLERADTALMHETKLLPNIAIPQFKQKGNYYFGYCVEKEKLSEVTGHFDDLMSIISQLDIEINRAFGHLIAKDNATGRDLSLFDKQNAAPIGSDKKFKYESWIEQWNKPLMDDFQHVENDDARRLLQLLQHYAGKNLLDKFSPFSWRHHRDDIAKVIAPYKKLTSLESFASVEQILGELKIAVDTSEENIIKPHGDLFALLAFIKDQTGIDYFGLKSNAAKTLQPTSSI